MSTYDTDKKTVTKDPSYPGAIKRLAMINDLTGFGRCSLAVTIPVVSLMQVQACPVPTSILSNHLGFSDYFFQDYTPYMEAYLNGFSKLDILFDGISCGFLGNEKQLEIINKFLQQNLTKGRKPLFILDPVLGDHGKTYSTITHSHCQKMRELVQYADILTPNITEACLLTGTTYKEDIFTEKELRHICEKLSHDKDKNIVITGLSTKTSIQNFVWESGVSSCLEHPIAGSSRPGTGDLFAAIIAADALNGVSLISSVKKAADFISLCIKESDYHNVPIKEGVLFEACLPSLLEN
ncbi:pyridoxamine kinase [Lachnospiraceae bacterium OttesenSCG-928-D06]|nr:pyridoxamine kinase [Lachnospiraceae bacterium OttesenSCG-928-D06]